MQTMEEENAYCTLKQLVSPEELNTAIEVSDTYQISLQYIAEYVTINGKLFIPELYQFQKAIDQFKTALCDAICIALPFLSRNKGGCMQTNKKKREKEDPVMPFGKYKGTRISKLPSNYLLWMAENMADGGLCYAADTEYQLREKENSHHN